ncbi:unnamed protein product [Nippostrongylus brasiliensis]|uniref:Uncharacterized protein n=1 Tax=Nippostrongylus brasiliensis TaxID=27835 RepID=A0A0N4Y2J5_NIPBR|nr:unnamed protein product [Nippostrongylus brasiliensis]
MTHPMINYTNLGDVLPGVCDELSITLRSPLYRAAQIINLLESVMACVLIIFVTLKYGQKLIFHPNTKIYQLSLSFSVTDNCRLFLPQMFYVINHLVIACSNCFMQYIQLGFVVERCVATIFVDTYETHCRLLGVFLVMVVLVCFAVYASAMTYIRLTKGSDTRWDPYKELAYLVPLCTLAIPLGSLIFLELWKVKRQRGIDGMISVKSQGPEGLNNYLTLLKQQWQ